MPDRTQTNSAFKIEGQEQKRSKWMQVKKHLDLFCSHLLKWALKNCMAYLIGALFWQNGYLFFNLQMFIEVINGLFCKSHRDLSCF